MTDQPGTDVALPSEKKELTLAQRITGMEHQFALAAPRGVEAQQLVRDALTALAQNPDLKECDPRSVLGGLMTMAQLGLRVGVLGHGWLIPFRNRKTQQKEAQLVIGYQGMIALAYRSNDVAKITARTVHENDQFSLEYGLNEHLTHRPSVRDRGKPTGYYATVKLKGSDDVMFYFMTHEEMCVYRDRYAMAKNRDGKVVGPWLSEFEGMAKKTCIRQLAKYMPKGTDLAVAMAVDDTVRVDIGPESDPVHVSAHPEPQTIESTVHVGGDDIPVEEPPADLGGEQ